MVLRGFKGDGWRWQTNQMVQGGGWQTSQTFERGGYGSPNRGGYGGQGEVAGKAEEVI